MKTASRLLRAAVALAIVLPAGACVSLFPKANPAQLYRFGVEAQPAAPSSASRVNLALAPLEFTAAASGDRIMTSDGNEAAYLADARWITPAVDMFDDALAGAFANAHAVRLIERRQATGATPILSVKVDTFEARYLSGPKAAPTVAVGVNVRLIRYPDRTIVAERHFDATAVASDNRVSTIVQAYDAATGQALKDMVAWADTTVPGVGPAPAR